MVGAPDAPGAPADDACDERASGGRQRQRDAGDVEDQRAEQGADHDERANERHVGDVGRAIGDTQQLDGFVGVLRSADNREQVAAVDRGARQDGDVGRGRAARDLPQEDAARLRHLHQVVQGLAVDRLVAHQDVDALDRHGQQLPVLDLNCGGPEHRHQQVA
jgi:hypothetical protein